MKVGGTPGETDDTKGHREQADQSQPHDEPAIG
jgi:hypothetical protein